jgi:predicted transcriptional regulator of viral defense system
MNTHLKGLKATSRQFLGELLKVSPGGFSVLEAAKILNISGNKAGQLLALWAKQGWLGRVRRGFYIPISLQATSAEAVPDEPWLIAHKLFSPCYIGGWTAAHHWGFTDQLFNADFVMTAKKVHQREQRLHGVIFYVKTILPRLIFGTQFIWSGKEKIAIADPTKTIIDALNDPAVVGGIRMVADILSAYLHSKEFNQEKLFEYAKKMNNSAIYKRLGFIIQSMPFENADVLIQHCKDNLKSGYSQLDPSVKGERLETRWHLWVPQKFNIKEEE